MKTRRTQALWFGVVVLAAALPAPLVRAQSSVGIYSTSSGVSCSLADNAPGLIEAYVVVRPGANGVTAAQFAAPRPSCFNATYLGDVSAPGTLSFGDSQSGISVALLGCVSQPTHVLTIRYMGTGTTPACCAYPVVNDPLVTEVLVADCLFNEEPADGVVSYVNADATCPCAGNSVPDEPDQPSPPNGATSVSVTTPLGWVATDIDDNLVEFDVYLGTDTSPPLVATVTEPAYAPGPLAELTTHYWRVVARDAGGLERAGALWFFTTRAANSAPLAPSAPDPFDGAVAMPLNQSLSWQCGDIDGDTLVYDVYFGTTPTPPLVASGVPSTSHTPPVLDYGTRYYWRVVARDSLHETAGPVWTFETRLSNYPPGVPYSPSPPDNTFDVPIEVTLGWQAGDTDGDTLTYDVYFGTAASPPLFASGVSERSLQLPTLLSGILYHWRVVAHDALTETSGPVWSFRTAGANAPPNPPFAPIPVHNVTNVSPTPVLQWQCTDPNGDALTYDIYFGATSPPPLVRTNHTTRAFSVGTLAFLTPYYWRIVARDSHGAEATGPTWTFTTRDNAPPNVPSSPIPANHGVASLSPVLSWTCVDPDGQPLSFDVYFGTDSDPPLAASGITLTSYLPGLLQDETTYYWRIVASDGLAVRSGPTWSFVARAPGGAGYGVVELWSDVGGTQCSLEDVGVAVRDVHVFVRPGPEGATALQFAAPVPGCFGGLYVGESIPSGLLSIGNTQDGIAIALTSCVASPMRVATMQFLTTGNTPPCCQYPVVADPNAGSVLVAGCNFIELTALTTSLWINPDDTCPCGGLTPVLISNFRARAADDGVDVAWELSGDESADHFTLLRRDGAATVTSIVASGPVTGAAGSHHDATVEPATTYHYELLVRTPAGDEFRSPVATVTTQRVELALGQNHPNPFNPTTAIPYTLPGGPATVRVRLLILDVAGGVVRTLVDENQPGGAHEVVWDGRDDRGGPVSSGVYFYVLDADKQRRTKKLVLLK